MHRIIKSVTEWNFIRNSNFAADKKIGFVPTMGALHKGHASLIESSKMETDITVVSIFVNPTQFNDPKDLQNYPRTFDSDMELLQRLNVNYLFYPWYKEIYPDNYRYKITESELSKILCGAHRPGHFDGVLSVVMRLLNIIKPHKAYFGEKDYQQYKLIEGMCKAFFINTEIVPCPTVRDEDGLAVSSRNLLLSDKERKLALNFPRLLQSGKNVDEINMELEKLGIKIDYIEEIEGRRYGAVFVGNVRLIDNVKL